EQGREQHAGEQLDQEIADRETGATGATAAVEAPVTEQWDVVEPADRLQTVAAPRTGPEDAFLQGESPDADIQQAADRRADDERPERPHHDRDVHEEVEHAAKIAE